MESFTREIYTSCMLFGKRAGQRPYAKCFLAIYNQKTFKRVSKLDSFFASFFSREISLVSYS